MRSVETVAMILAGGQGSRLGVLTKNIAKPAVPFGGKYRIIDFPLTNCAHSGIDTVGVLTQYQPLELNTYIGNGADWDLDRKNGGVYILPPYMKTSNNDWYKGTANAIFQNANFVDKFNAEYVVVLSGDHIYKMDYDKMVSAHKKSGADATIAVIEVPWEEASRYGILTADENNKITEFNEKPEKPNSNLASMGVYVFTWSVLKKYLQEDDKNKKSHNDFGKNIIPLMLQTNANLYVYRFNGYWKDVGTVHSLWEANMDLLDEDSELNLDDSRWRIFSKNYANPPEYVDVDASVEDSYVSDGCDIRGTVKRSIIFDGVKVGKNTIIEDSVIMADVNIGDNCVIRKTIIDVETKVEKDVVVGERTSDENPYKSRICSKGVCLIGSGLTIRQGTEIYKNSMIDSDI